MNKWLLFLFLPFCLIGQGEYNQWRFGYGSGLDFNSGSPIVVQSSIQSPESAASVSDCSGQLLFYTDGETVWSWNNSMMDGGFDLRGVGGVYPSSQGAIIVKRPNSSSIYFIFTASDIYGVNYSVVNMAANGGLGKVIQKNTKLSSGLTQKLGVTYHQNQKDIWVITHYQNSNLYEAFLVNQTGISPSSVKSPVGPTFTSSHGDIKFNQQGTKVGAVVQDQNLITLADFNNATGLVSNSIGIIGQINSPHGCEFSSSGNKFYVSAWGLNGGVIQFQVASNNSTTLTTNVQNISGNFKPNGSLQLAPDGKIYVAHEPDFWSVGSYLGVINYPQNTGSSAGFNKDGIYLGSSGSSWELPNVTLTNNNIPQEKEILAEEFCFNSETEFSLSNTTGIVDVLWDFDDVNSGVLNFSNDTAPNHVFSAPGTYNVRVTVNNVCEIEEYSRLIIIDEGPVSQLDSLWVCSSMNTDIGFFPESNITYTWSPSQGLSSSNISNPIFNSSSLEGDVFTYFLTSVSPEGCSFIDTLSLVLNEEQKAGDDQRVCPGFGVTLTVDSGVTSANWLGTNINDASSLSPYVNPLISSLYTVELTDTNGCVVNDSVFVEINPDVLVDAGEDTSICYGDSIAVGNNISPDSTSFSWELATLILDSNSGETVAFPLSSQWFYLTATNDTCSSTDSVYIHVNSLPNVTLQPEDTNICFGDTLNFLADGALNYIWYLNQDSINNTSDYQFISNENIVLILEGVDVNGCLNTDSSMVSILPLPEIKLNNDTAICFGQSMEMLVSGGSSYEWLNNEISGLSDSSVQITPDSSSIYIVRANGVNGCYILDSTEVIVNGLPQVGVMSDTLICEGSNAYVWASGGVEYSWYPPTYLNQTSGREILSTPESQITYTVVVTDENNCVDSAQTSISLNVNPTANFNYTFIPSCNGFEVQFSDSSLLADSYNWVFGDGNFSDENSPFNVFNFGTNSNTVLTVGNNGICFDSMEVNFEWGNISEVIEVFSPNIITPNNDSRNDCFEVIVPPEFIQCTNYEVYNRWGMKVYDTKEFTGDFCGINAYNNKPVNPGTYYYTIEVGDYVVNGFIQVERD
ncbi:MAG: hypothetical protein CMD35_07685 [Flavobacteriales bacterium]|nr:hypothetical protein [Flavobacteriales bacterium]